MDVGELNNQTRQPVKMVRWRTGKRHITIDGVATVCGFAVASDRVMSVEETADWPELVNCYNCAYRHTPPGYVQPGSGNDFPLKKECPNHPGRGQAADSCHACGIQTAPVQGPTARRTGERWSESEYDQLIELLRNGLPLEDIAQRLGRGVNAVAGRCQRLLPPGHHAHRGDADLVLRAYLANDSNYEWRDGLRDEATQRGRFYWDSSADIILRNGWNNVRPLSELVAATGAGELDVAARLVELKLAASTTEVAVRLGCEPNGTLDIRVRLAADRAAAAVWVLIADGLRGSERAKELDHPDGPKMYRHISLHARQEDARHTLDRLLTGHTTRGGAPDEVSVTFAHRTVGDLAIGETHHQRTP